MQRGVLDGIGNHGGGQEGKAASETFAESSSFGEILVLAASWSGASNAIKMADHMSFKEKS